MKNATPAQIDAAFAACRSIRFAVKNAARFGGEFSLNDLLAADKLAREALGETAPVVATKPVLKKRSVKKGGAS